MIQIEDNIDFLPFLYAKHKLYDVAEEVQKETKKNSFDAPSEPIVEKKAQAMPTSKIIEKNVEKPKIKEDHLQLPIKGSAKSGVLLLIAPEDLPLKGTGKQQLLKAIWNACDIELTALQLLNTGDATRNFTFEELKEIANFHTLVAFGVSSIMLFEREISNYHAFEMQKTSILFADLLGTLEQDRSKKRALWEALQTMPFFTKSK
ncbi:MAG: hypothetical protein JJT94_01120 [Bernardetiaceae bacterium]|nr:hypothetical protein [Bernardetiaceae bacterium]